jgi:hypothetical protein
MKEMKKPHLVLVLLLFACFSASAQQADLGKLKKQYDDSILVIEIETAQSQSALVTAYTNEINVLRNKTQKAGDLDKLKTILAEVARVQAEQTLPSTLPDVSELKAIGAAYQQCCQEAKIRRAQRIVALASQYDKALDTLQRRLTQEGKLDDATAVQAERQTLPASEPLATARTLLRTTQGTAQPPASGLTETRKVPDQRLPAEFKGKFYVSVDDAATIYLKGRQVHQAPINESVSSETTVKLGDSITVNLINTRAGHRFTMAFLTKDEKCVINFRQEDCRVLWDSKKRSLTQKEFEQLKQAPTKEMDHAPASFPFSTTSDWMWGPGDNSWLTTIVTKEMITKQE